MIDPTYLTINGRQFIRRVSDLGVMIERDGVRYSEAIDPADLGRTYTETDEPVDVVELSETEEKARAYDILTGVSG